MCSRLSSVLSTLTGREMCKHRGVVFFLAAPTTPRASAKSGWDGPELAQVFPLPSSVTGPWPGEAGRQGVVVRLFISQAVGGEFLGYSINI